MRVRSLVLLVLGLPAAAAQVAAQDKGAFLVRLGNDTTGVEQFDISRTRAEVIAASRAPRAGLRRATISLTGDWQFSGIDIAALDPSAPGNPPRMTTSAKLLADSIGGQSKADTTTRFFGLKVKPGTETPGGSMWVMYERLSLRRAKMKADSLRVPMYFLSDDELNWAAVRKLGSDSVDIETTYDRYHAKIDKDGRILGLRPISGTQQFSLERLPSADVQAWASTFATQEKAKGPAGQFSPRDTARADAAGAHLVIDYGRPSVRGRVIFGGVVPWNEVWRTGANAATQFFTDKPVKLGNTVVPAGKYTLWTVPTPTGWTLIVNGETGQWGTAHKAEKDLYKIPMMVQTKDDVTEKFFIHIADEGGHGQWHFVWEKTVAAVDFAVQ
ncbi:MAG: DUF2911 domain-containing protein [Gemmatimonadales bacterium]